MTGSRLFRIVVNSLALGCSVGIGVGRSEGRSVGRSE